MTRWWIAGVVVAGALAHAETRTPTKKPDVTTVQVVGLSGKRFELYLNGKHVTKGQSATVGKDGKLELRAAIVDPRREQARRFVRDKTSARDTQVIAASEYVLVYSKDDKTFDWRVAAETYEWKPLEVKSGKVTQTVKSSGTVAKDDVLEIAVPADGDTIRGGVSGSIEWKGPADETASEGLTYELKIQR